MEKEKMNELKRERAQLATRLAELLDTSTSPSMRTPAINTTSTTAAATEETSSSMNAVGVSVASPASPDTSANSREKEDEASHFPEASHSPEANSTNANPDSAARDASNCGEEEAEHDVAAVVLPRAEQVVKSHIAQLHEYNALKDIATGLMGLIAERRGVRVVDVMTDFGVAAD